MQKIAHVLVVSGIVFVYLIAVNALLFPVVFPDGLAEDFTNLRPVQLNSFHLLAFAATAFLLTWLILRRGPDSLSTSQGARYAALLGLFVALPEHLHLYAMVDAPAVDQFIPVLWICVTWAVAGFLVALAAGRLPRAAHQADTSG